MRNFVCRHYVKCNSDAFQNASFTSFYSDPADPRPSRKPVAMAAVAGSSCWAPVQGGYDAKNMFHSESESFWNREAAAEDRAEEGLDVFVCESPTPVSSPPSVPSPPTPPLRPPPPPRLPVATETLAPPPMQHARDPSSHAYPARSLVGCHTSPILPPCPRPRKPSLERLYSLPPPYHTSSSVPLINKSPPH